MATSPPQVGEKLRNLNLDRLLIARLLKHESKGRCIKNTAYHPSFSGAMKNTGAVYIHTLLGSSSSLQFVRSGSWTPKVQTTSSQLLI